MNCKPGDLAIVVKPGPHIGKVIRVISLDPVPSPTGRPLWLYEGSIVDETGVRYESVWDHVLHPIRPGDLEDETPTVRELEAA